MADGRDLIEQVLQIVQQITGQVDNLPAGYSADDKIELTEIVASATKWAGLCRQKIWLRGQEGTGMAQGCLDAATQMQSSLAEPAVAIEAAADLSGRLEALARLISTKSQVLT